MILSLCFICPALRPDVGAPANELDDLVRRTPPVARLCLRLEDGSVDAFEPPTLVGSPAEETRTTADPVTQTRVHAEALFPADTTLRLDAYRFDVSWNPENPFGDIP